MAHDGNERQKLKMLQNTNRQRFSLVYTLIDHRTDLKMFKTLQ